MNIGMYLKVLLQKKNMSQMDLVNKLNEMHLSDGKVYKNKMSEYINGHLAISPYMARKIEIAMELPKYSLVKLVGFPERECDKEKLEGIKARI